MRWMVGFWRCWGLYSSRVSDGERGLRGMDEVCDREKGEKLAGELRWWRVEVSLAGMYAQ